MADTIRAHGSVEVPAAAAEVFSYVGDHANAPLFIPCLRRLRPVGARTYGLGSRFVAELSFAGLHYSFEFQVTQFDPGRLMAARTIGGPTASSRWEFQPGPDGTTIADFACECEVPRVLQGMAGCAVVGIARQALRHGLEEGLSRLCYAFETRATGAPAVSAAKRALPA